MSSPSRPVRALVWTTIFSLLSPGVYANPVGGSVQSGNATIAATGQTLSVNQTSDKALIDWRSFDIAPGETTKFKQPSASSLTVNRINDSKPSSIFGTLSANGNLVLLNQNGILFGQGSKVDAAGLLASTSKLDETQFKNGKLAFTAGSNPNASVINNGQITAKEAGLVGLVAPQVQNNGTISAKLGKVHLASGDAFALDLAGDGLIQVQATGNIGKQLVSNAGAIQADGGTVNLTAAAARSVVDSLVQNSGVIQAESVGAKTGTVRLYAEGANAVEGNISASKGQKQGASYALNSGIIDASGYRKSENGGKVRILGDNVGLFDGSVIDVSGDAGGGDTRIGGDRLGQGTTPTAINTLVTPNAWIFNDAITKGDGGRTIVWSDGNTGFYGNISGRGGKDSGNGGFVETSGHGHLDALGSVDLTAANGKKGTYLLDPTDIVIYGNVDPAFQSTDGTINLATNLKLWLDASDTSKVNLTYNSLGTTATGSSGANTITVSANTGLVVGARIRLGGAGAVTAASTVGSDTYTISGISGTTITLASNLTANYSGSGVYQGYVSQLTDKSGQGNNATQGAAGSMPLWISNGQNGLGVVQYDGVNDTLQTSRMIQDDFSILAFFKATAGLNGCGSAQFYCGSSIVQAEMPGIVDDFGSSIKADGTIYAGTGRTTGSTDTSIASASGYADGNSHLMIFTRQKSNGSLNLYLDSATSGSATGGTQSLTSPTTIYIGSNTGSIFYFNGTIPEVIAYNTNLATNSRNLLEQYQSAKWGIALKPPGTGATEVAQATASNGYSVFSSRYLERLSQSADIMLQATNNINLDLKGDTINFATSGRALTLTAGNQITTASAGNITTNGGNIALNATNGIVLNNSIGLTTNGGNLALANNATLGANQNWNAGSGTMTFSGTVNGGSNLTANAGTFSFASALGGTTPLSTVSLTSANALSLPSITASSITARTTGAAADLTIPVGKTLTASGAGTPITLAAGRNFINNAGSSALSAASGRWLVYSTNPASDTTGSLANNFRLFSCAYAGSCPSLGSGNGFLYSYTPQLTATPDALSITYGQTPGYTYSLSGYLGSDSGADTITGSIGGFSTNATTSATSGKLNAGTWNITDTAGTLASAMGYSITGATRNNGLTVGQKAITVTAATNSKTYDGTTTGAATGSITTGTLAAGDSATWTEVYTNKNVGAGNRTLTASGDTVSDGNSGNNYAVTFVDNATGSITARAITVTAATNSKTYDGTTSAAATGSITTGSLAAGDSATWTEVYTSKTVGAGNKTLTATGDVVTDGNSGNNYAVTFVDNATGTITAKALSITGVTGTNKTYDGTTADSISGTATLNGTIGGDTVNLGTGSAAGLFADKNVGNGKTVSFSGYTIGGADSGNYTLSQPANSTANITAKTITASLAGSSTKTYDGNTNAVLAAGNYSLSGVVGGDTVNLNNPAAGTYADKNVGAGKVVSVNGLTISGADSGNYALASNSISAAIGTITAKALAILGVTAPNKTYDGTTTATLNTGGDSLSGVIGGDTVSLSNAGATGAFADKNAGNGKVVTTSGFSINGADSGNYSLSQPSVTADINPAHLTVTADNQDAIQGNRLPTLTATLSGFVGGETLATSGVTGAPALSTTGSTSSVPGPYPIIAALGTLAAGNYDFQTFLNGVLTIEAPVSAGGGRPPVVTPPVATAPAPTPVPVAAPSAEFIPASVIQAVNAPIVVPTANFGLKAPSFGVAPSSVVGVADVMPAPDAAPDTGTSKPTHATADCSETGSRDAAKCHSHF